MKNLLILGITLAVMLFAGPAMAAGDQAPEMFDTLGQMQTVENTAIAQMTDTELNAVEGKSFRDRKFRKNHKVGLKINARANFNKTTQFNDCFSCFASGGTGGGGNINQINDNLTVQN